MKSSKGEKLLLVLLIFLAIGVIYYQFIYVKHIAILKELKTKEEEVSLKYDTMLEKVNTIEKNKTDIKIFRESIESKSMLLYPELYQEKIILEVNKLLNEAGIKGSISFSEVTVASVEKYFAKETSENIEPSLKQSAEEVKQLNGTEVEGSKDSGNDKVSEEEEVQSTEVKEDLLVEQMRVSISFTGTYANTTKFVQLVSEYARLIAMPTISLSASGEEKVSGSLDLEFYSIPKITDEDSEYLKWDIENSYGKENPFLEGGTGINTSESKNDESYDIAMSIKGANSDLPSVTLGKVNDSKRDTYIYFDKNEKVDIDIEINEDDGKYYIKYKMPDSSYPANYNDNGIEINPGEGKIQIAIYSTKRLNVEDKVSVNVNVTSNTSEKMTLVTIMDDDKTSPRININVKGKVEYVIK